MYYPDDFYIYVPGEEETFTRHAPGSLHVGRLITNQDAWRKRQPGLVKQKRPLFCNIQSESLDKKQIIEALRNLLRDGFEVYVLPQPTLFSHSSGALRLHEDMLQHAMVDLCLDNIRYPIFFERWEHENKYRGGRSLTHFDMERLILNQPKLTRRTLYVTDFSHLDAVRIKEHGRLHYRRTENNEYEYVDSVLSYVRDEEPEKGFTETRVIWNSFSVGQATGLRQLPRRRRYIHEKQIQEFTLIESFIEPLLKGELLTNGYIAVGLADLASVSTLNCLAPHDNPELILDRDSPDNLLGRLLPHLPKLENLSIAKLPNTSNWPMLPSLRSVSSEWATTPENQVSLLEKCPNLTQLKFRVEMNPTAEQVRSWHNCPPLPPLPALKLLNISHSPTDVAQGLVEKFSLAAPNLEKLICKSFFPTQDTLLSLLDRCSGIQSLELHQIENCLNADSFAQALNQHKNLRSIELIASPVLSSTEDLNFWQTLVKDVPALGRFTKDVIKLSIRYYKKHPEELPGQNTAPPFVMPSAEEIRRAFRDFADIFKPGQLTEAFAGFNFSDMADVLKGINPGDLLKAIGGMEGLAALGVEGLKALSESGLLTELMTLKTARAFLFQPPRFGNDPGPASSSNTAPPTPLFSAFDLQSAFKMLPQKQQKASDCRGQHKALDYRMVEDRLGQFLQLQAMEDEAPLVPSLRDVLPALAEQYGPIVWQKALTFLSEWNGDAGSLTETHITWLNRIQDRAAACADSPSLTWLGETAIDWLATQNQPCMLSSPWRSVTVFPLQSEVPGNRDYFIYDPQFEKGQLQVSHAALPGLLNQLLGPLSSLRVHARTERPTPTISCNPFLEEGGLLALLDTHCAEVTAQFGQPPQLHELSATALQSLMMRTTKGTPAWLAVLESQQQDLIPLTLTLLAEYIRQNPTNYWELLQQSIVDREGFTRDQMLALLCNSMDACGHALSAESRHGLSDINDLVTALALEDSDRENLRARRQQSATYASLEEYCDALLHKSGSHRIEMPNADTLQAFKLALLEQSINSSRPVIFIDRPDELMCSNPFVQRQADQVTGLFIDQPPAGPMRDALNAGGEPPLIVLNSDKFTPTALIQFNTLLDEFPVCDGEKLPAGTGVLLLENGSNPSRHRGGEFYSRIGSWETWPFENGMLPFPDFPPCAMSAEQDPWLIDVYHAIDWKEQLLGYWAPRKDRLEWIPGKLEEALQKNRPIMLANAPLEKMDCRMDLHMARKQGFFNHEDLRIPYPPGGFAWSTGYDWSRLAQSVSSWRPGLRPGAQVLNAYNLTDFDMRYVCDDNSREVNTINGLIKAHAGQNLEVNLTHALDEAQCARLLDECKRHEVTLLINSAEEQLLPEALRSHLAAPDAALPPLQPVAHTRLLHSQDPDVTRRQLGYKDVMVIDISECSPAHLLHSVDGFFERSGLKLRFNNTRGLLPDLLKQYPTVVLRGHFTEEHAQALTPFLLDRMAQTDEHLPALLLLPDNPQDVALSFWPSTDVQVSQEEKLQYLAALCNPADLPEDKLASEGLCQLEARARFLRHSPGLSTDLAWEGLEDLPNNLNIGAPDFANSQAIAGAFFNKRIHDLFTRLDVSPLVVLVGLTGVGKSTLIEKELAKIIGRRPWMGAAELRQWATDENPGRKYIFLDEVNIGNRQWSELEGLFEKPKHIRIGNEVLYLSDDHVVITASNPASYGDNRKIAPLFLRHGNVLVLDPMPPEYLYESILKPRFEEAEMLVDAQVICAEILRLYAFFCQHSKDKVLISPRELEEIALFVIARRRPDETPLQTTQYYVRMIGETLAEGALCTAFDEQFPPNSPRRPGVLDITQPLVASVKAEKPFRYTSSRWPVTNLLESLISLRELRLQLKDTASEAMLYGGLGGVVLEGPAGVGKSALVRHLLSLYGCSPDNPDRPLYIIPASMHIDAKKALLLKAFEEGAFVLMDEINAAERLEDFLNDLLMGKHPISKERPAKPGMTLIATQNPVSDGARIQGSNAASRRLITVQVPEYPPNQQVDLLQDQQLTRARAQLLVNITEKENQANQQDRSKKLTFRDVLRYAEDMITPPPLQDAKDDSMESDEPFLPVYVPPARPESPEEKHAFDKLFKAIEALRVYGQRLKSSPDTLSKTTGRDAITLAKNLRDSAQDLRANPGSKTRHNQLMQQLDDGYKTMGEHRSVWLPILYNIYLAAQNLTWFIIDVISKRSFFSPRTERQTKVHGIIKAMREIDAGEEKTELAEPQLDELDAASML